MGDDRFYDTKFHLPTNFKQNENSIHHTATKRFNQLPLAIFRMPLKKKKKKKLYFNL